MSGTTLPNWATAAAIRARLASRRKAARWPSRAASAESRPQPLKLAWVSKSGQNKRRSRPANHRPTRADLPTPLGPARSRTLRKVAVWSRRAKACCPWGVSNPAWAEGSPKGTAVAPHWRAKSESSRLGAFFIDIGSLDLAVEVGVDRLGQTEGRAVIQDLDAVEFEGVEAQLHRQRAQAQIHFVEVIAQPHGAVAADGAGELMVEQLVQVQVRVQGFDQVGAALITVGGRHAGAGMNPAVIHALQPEGELGIEFGEAAGALARQTQAGFEVLLNSENY